MRDSGNLRERRKALEHVNDAVEALRERLYAVRGWDLNEGQRTAYIAQLDAMRAYTTAIADRHTARIYELMSAFEDAPR